MFGNMLTTLNSKTVVLNISTHFGMLLTGMKLTNALTQLNNNHKTHFGGSFLISNEFLINLQWKNHVISATIGKGIIEK